MSQIQRHDVWFWHLALTFPNTLHVICLRCGSLSICAYGITIIVLEVNIIFSLNLNQVLRKHMLCVVSCHCNFNLMIFNYNILLLLLLILLLPPPLLLLLLLLPPPQLLQLLRLLVAVNMSAMSYSQHVLLWSQLELVCKNL